MKDTGSNANIGIAPEEYSKQQFDLILRNISLALNDIRAVGPIRVSTINISNLPTSATGLRVGDLWNDTGTVKVVT